MPQPNKHDPETGHSRTPKLLTYEQFTDQVSAYPSAQEHDPAMVTPGVTYTALGLSSEAGEVASHIKKALRDEQGCISVQRRVELIFELGDVLFYVTRLARHLGANLDDLIDENVAKLESRKRRGKISGSGDHR